MPCGKVDKPLTRPNYRLKQLDPNHRTSPGTWSPGPSASARLKQQAACIPTLSLACGKQSDSPRHPRPAHQRLTVVIYVAPDFGTRQAVGGFLAECDCG